MNEMNKHVLALASTCCVRYPVFGDPFSLFTPGQFMWIGIWIVFGFDFSHMHLHFGPHLAPCARRISMLIDILHPVKSLFLLLSPAPFKFPNCYLGNVKISCTTEKIRTASQYWMSILHICNPAGEAKHALGTHSVFGRIQSAYQDTGRTQTGALSRSCAVDCSL